MKKRAPVPFNTTHFKERSKKEGDLSTKEKFTRIHETNHWAADSKSGKGADKDQVEEIKLLLPSMIQKYKAKIFLDLPCGDHNWMNTVDLQVEKYIGGDIVNEIIEQNKVLYPEKHKAFVVIDLLTDELPEADILFCRDCLVHLSNKDIFKAIGNVKRSNITYLITTTFIECNENPDIVTGDWRIINLEKPPFNFPPPIEMINEKCTEGDGTYADKSLGVWAVSEL